MQADDNLKEGSQYNEINPDNISAFIEEMEKHRKTCEEEGRYVEAEMAKNRVEELKEQEFQSRREELLFNQAQQREECEQ